MSTRNRIPSAVEPHLQLLPEASLTLLTGTLGCSPNWLTALFVGSVLGSKSDPAVDTGNNDRYGVILVSWLRDLQFWKDQIRRTAGLDISKFSQQSRFAFMDCLSLHSDLNTENALGHTERAIKEAISKSPVHGDKRQVLILDNPDVLLATQSTTAKQLNVLIMKLRSLVHSIVISCSADLPFIAAATSSSHTPMEVETAAFLTQQGHLAHSLMSVRELSSGAAKDVSGVLRITTRNELGETEVLYLVQRDGSVKVFGRGEGSV